MNPFLKNEKRVDVDGLLCDILVHENTQWTEYRIRKLNETSKMKMADRVVTKLFKSIREKSMNLDFNDIDASKGNITTLHCYSDLENAIKYLRNLGNSKNNDVKNKNFVRCIDELDVCLRTVKKYTNDFTSAYKIKNVSVMFLYQSICIALLEGTSFVIANSIELVKTGSGITQEVKNTEKLLKNNYIASIIKFNELEKSNKLRKALSELQQIKESITVSGIMVGITVVGLLFTLMRSIIFAYYHTRVNLSQYLAGLKQFILLNASTVTDKNIREKQQKIADKLGKLSDLIAVDQEVATSRTNSEITDQDRTTSNQTDEPSQDNDDFGIF